MKNYLVTYTRDRGETLHVESVTAADYTKAFLSIVYKYLWEDIIITSVREV